MNKPALVPNIDYYINTDGNLVFTEKYHLDRGFCCQSGCLHCPYHYASLTDPNIPAELNTPWSQHPLTEFDEEE